MVIKAGLILLIISFSFSSFSSASQTNFQIKENWFTQPADPSSPKGQQFQQQFFVLTPNGVTNDATVFFVLGNEQDTTEGMLTKMYQAYGSPTDMIFVIAEHRGYGQSVTDESQTLPEYVRVEYALSDYQRLITSLKKTYTGKWLAAGYSYGGALVLNFAHDYPQSVDAILSSSPPIHWSFEIPQYSKQARENLGEDFTKRLYDHINNIEVVEPYDESWQTRERYIVLISILSQRTDMQDTKDYLSGLSYLPTSMYTWFLEQLLPEGVDDWAIKRIPQPLTVEQAKGGRFNWYTWKYQQCTQVGSFFSGIPFNYRLEEHIADCKATFGKEPEYLTAKKWDVASMIPQITIPQVIVSGGKDPWTQLGVKPDHSYNNIDFVYVAEGFHCPDKEDVQIGSSVMAKLRGHIK